MELLLNNQLVWCICQFLTQEKIHSEKSCTIFTNYINSWLSKNCNDMTVLVAGCLISCDMLCITTTIVHWPWLSVMYISTGNLHCTADISWIDSMRAMIAMIAMIAKHCDCMYCNSWIILFQDLYLAASISSRFISTYKILWDTISYNIMQWNWIQ